MSKTLTLPCDVPWAIEPAALQQAVHALGAMDAAAPFRAPQGEPPPPYKVDEFGLAVIRFQGVVVKRPSWFSRYFGDGFEACTTKLIEAVAASESDPAVKSRLVVIDSPGGIVDGMQEAADALYRARSGKPIVAFADDCCASAAYMIGCQASKVYANALARLGSIGVFSTLRDYSRMFKNEGIETIVVRAGEAKGRGAMGTLVDDRTIAEAQRSCDAVYGGALVLVMRGRSMDLAEARTLADGRVHIGQAAADLRLIDGVMPLDDLIGQLRADLEPPAPTPAVSVVVPVPCPDDQDISSNKQGASSTEAREEEPMALDDKDLKLLDEKIAASQKPMSDKLDKLVELLGAVNDRQVAADKALANVQANKALEDLIADGKRPNDKGAVRLSPAREKVVRAAFEGAKGDLAVAKTVLENFEYDVPGSGSAFDEHKHEAHGIKPPAVPSSHDHVGPYIAEYAKHSPDSSRTHQRAIAYMEKATAEGKAVSYYEAVAAVTRNVRAA